MNSTALHDKKMKISSKLLGLCRTCLTAENESEAELYPIGDIFLEEDELTSQVQSFEEVLCLFVDNEVGDQKDRLPKIMCLTCIDKARSAYQFIEMCRQTDALLLELLNDEQKDEQDTKLNLKNDQKDIQDTKLNLKNEQKDEKDTKPIIDDVQMEELDGDQRSEVILPDTAEETVASAQNVLHIEEIHINPATVVESQLEFEVLATFNRNEVVERISTETKQKQRHVCDVCQKSFTQSQTLNRHRKIHFRDTEPGKACNFCDREFLRSDDLRRHIRTHTNERPYACDLCNKAYKQSYELKEHKALSHPESGVRQYISCTLCDKKLSTRNGYYVHMKAHRGEKNHVCLFCGKRYITTGELSSHLKHIHPNEVNAEKFACGVGECPRKFVTKAALRHHRSIKHDMMGDETNYSQTDESGQ